MNFRYQVQGIPRNCKKLCESVLLKQKCCVSNIHKRKIKIGISKGYGIFKQHVTQIRVSNLCACSNTITSGDETL